MQKGNRVRVAVTVFKNQHFDVCYAVLVFPKREEPVTASPCVKTHQPIRNRKCACYKVFKNLQPVLLFLLIGQPQISHILSKISYTMTILLHDNFKKF